MTNQAAQASRTGRPVRHLIVWLGLVVVAVLALGVTGWWLWPVSVITPPQVPLEGVDPEIASAINQARTALLNSPRTAASWGLFGEVLMAHEFYPEASQCFRQAHELDPGNSRWPYLQGMTTYHADPKASVTCFERAAERAGKDYVPHLRLAETYLSLDRFDDADKAFRKVLELHPGNPRAFYGLGRAALQRDQLREAVGYLSLAADNPVSRQAAQLALAELYQREGNAEAAQQAEQRARGLPPDSPWPDPILEAVQARGVGLEGRLTQARQFWLVGKPRDSLLLLDQLLQKAPDFAKAHALRGAILVKEGNYQAAETALKECLRLAPDDASSLAMLGGVFAAQRKLDDAIDCLEKAFNLQPSLHETCVNLSRCLVERGKRSQAQAALREGLRYRPDSPLLHLELGKLLLEEGQASAAVPILEKSVTLAPEDDSARMLLDAARKTAQPRPQ